ncbi:MAG: hypothetical protein ACR2I5_00975 [Candidatus Limnocylindria bacterium]
MPVGIGDLEAYRYLPTFAHLLVPLTAIPALALTWLYRLVVLLCLRYLVGGWIAVGWALLFPPVWIELLVLNLTLPIAAAARFALRGSAAGAAATPLAGVLKYGSLLLIPYLWIRRPLHRRPILMGSAVLVIALILHFMMDQGTWLAYGTALLQQSQGVNDAADVNDQLLFLLPSTLDDFVLRWAIATGLIVVAIWRRWDWLAFVGAMLAVPTLWVARLAPLVAVPRLWSEDLARRREEVCPKQGPPDHPPTIEASRRCQDVASNSAGGTSLQPLCSRSRFHQAPHLGRL